MRGHPGFFDVDERLKRLSDLGDHLEAFLEAVDFEIFRADLAAVLGYCDGAQGGRPPFDAVMMFKILVIQAMDNLSDERAEFLITTVCRSCGSLDCRCQTGFPMRARSGCFAKSSPRLDRTLVRTFRCGASRLGLYRHVGPDRRRQPGCGPEAETMA
jgi:hypothetical protein